MIKFFRGAKGSYNSASSTFTDAIYFATDTGEILVNGKSYGGGLKDATWESNVLTLTKADGNTVVADFTDKLLTAADRTALDNVQQILSGSDLNVTYNTKLDDNLTTIEKLGGIAAGTKVSSLKGKTITAVLDDLLFPTVNPTFVEPTLSVTWKNYANPQIIGAAAPTRDNFNIVLNKGQIKIGNNVQGTRVGDITETILNGNTELPTKVVEGNNGYSITVKYAEGPQPKDSKGNNYGSPKAAGSIITTINFTGVYPFYVGNQKSTNQLAATTATTLTGIKLAAEAAGAKHVFKLPKKYTVTKIETLNTLSGKYETYGLENFTQTTESITVNGTAYDYTVYTRNDAGLNGEVTYQITYTK